MSDINVRFDGLILLLGLAMAVVVYLVIAGVALVVAIVRSNKRAWKVGFLDAKVRKATWAG